MNIKEIKEQIKNDKKIDLRKTIENNIYNSLSEGTQFKCVDTLLKEIGNKHSEDELIQVCKELGCDIFLFKTIKYVSFGELNIENFIELKKRERINNISSAFCYLFITGLLSSVFLIPVPDVVKILFDNDGSSFYCLALMAILLIIYIIYNFFRIYIYERRKEKLIKRL